MSADRTMVAEANSRARGGILWIGGGIGRGGRWPPDRASRPRTSRPQGLFGGLPEKTHGRGSPPRQGRGDTASLRFEGPPSASSAKTRPCTRKFADTGPGPAPRESEPRAKPTRNPFSRATFYLQYALLGGSGWPAAGFTLTFISFFQRTPASWLRALARQGPVSAPVTASQIICSTRRISLVFFFAAPTRFRRGGVPTLTYETGATSAT